MLRFVVFVGGQVDVAEADKKVIKLDLFYKHWA